MLLVHLYDINFTHCFPYSDHCTARRGLAVCLEDANHPSSVQPDGKQCLMVTDRVKEASSAEDAEHWDDLTMKYQ